MADIRAVLVDLDDTLYAERRFVLSGLRHLAQVIDAAGGADRTELFRTAVAALRRGPRHDVLQSVCRTHRLPSDEIPQWVALLRAHAPDLRLPRASVRALATLRAEGRKVVVLTNGLVEVQRRKALALGLAPLVDAVVYADAIVPGGKPAAACFHAALDAVDVAARHAVMVGNAPVDDLAGARAAGLRTVLVGRPPSPCPYADLVVASIEDVPSALARLERLHAHAC